MTIALVCPDGLSVLLFCQGIIRGLQRIDGARVLVVSSDGEYAREIETLGVTSVSVSIARFVHPLRDLHYLWSLYRVFRRERCQVVFNFSTKPNVYGSIAARAAGVPKVVSHVVGLGTAFLPALDVRARLVQGIARRLYRIACRLSDRVWFTNKNDLAYFSECGIVTASKAVLTKNYLDTDSYRPAKVSREQLVDVRKEFGLGADDRVVVMVARMIWPKGVREFAEAAEYLRDRYPEVQFFLVGPSEEGSRGAVPESYLRERERSANFRWLGFRRDVRTLYALADVAVLPSYYKEGGYPRTLLEPMAMGKPIITTDSADCKEVVEEGRNGYCVPVGDSRALGDAMARVLDDAELRMRLGEYSRFKAEREFDEKRVVVDALVQLGLLPAGS